MTNAADDRPMMDMNTTPLIDVMLVLLIMFIMTIPIATHSIEIDLPRPCPGDCPIVDTVKNKIVIEANDTVLWNGQPVEDEQLAALLEHSLALPVEPELQLEPVAAASYRKSAETINRIKQAGVTRFGFVGNERYRSFAAD